VEKVDYNVRQHVGYVAARQMPSDSQRIWMETLARHVPETRPLTWLDLGSGTGRMTPLLADTFGGPVHGVEPSAKMREQAAEHSSATYAAGSAEDIPLPDASVDAALLFFMWHHVVDHAAAAREVLRVVRPGGKVFVQANFGDRMPDVWWFRVMPEWKAVDAGQFRTEARVKADFTDAGWTLVAHEEVTWTRSASLAEDVAKLRLKSVSLFDLMGEDVVAEGFARIEAALPTLDPGPQHETSQLLVFER